MVQATAAAGDARASYEILWSDIGQCTRCLDDARGHSLRSAAVFCPLPGLGVMPRARPVRFLLFGSEPSAGWTDSNVEARAMVGGHDGNLPFRNFNEQSTDWLFQFAIERWLVDVAHESYVLSDIAKCAVSVNEARKTPFRLTLCASTWLARELETLKPSAIIAIGGGAHRTLKAIAPGDLPLECVPHPSGANAHLYASWDGVDSGVAQDDVVSFVRSRRTMSRQTKRSRDEFVPTSNQLKKFLGAYKREFTRVRSKLALPPLV